MINFSFHYWVPLSVHKSSAFLLLSRSGTYPTYNRISYEYIVHADVFRYDINISIFALPDRSSLCLRPGLSGHHRYHQPPSLRGCAAKARRSGGGRCGQVNVLRDTKEKTVMSKYSG